MAFNNTTNMVATSSTSRPIVLSSTNIKLVELSCCNICKLTYTNEARAPIALPCGHTYCKVCVKNQIIDTTFYCNSCEVVSVISSPLNKNLVHIQFLRKLNMLGTDKPATKTATMAAKKLSKSVKAKKIPDSVIAKVNPIDMENTTRCQLRLVTKFLSSQLVAFFPVQDARSAIKLTETISLIPEATKVLQTCLRKFETPLRRALAPKVHLHDYIHKMSMNGENGHFFVPRSSFNDPQPSGSAGTTSNPPWIQRKHNNQMQNQRGNGHSSRKY